MLCRFNSRDIKYKRPFGGVPVGENTEFYLEIESEVYPRDVALIIRADGGETQYFPTEYIGMKDGFSSFKVAFCPEKAGLYFYKFGFNCNYGYAEIKNTGNGQSSAASDGCEYQLTAHGVFSETRRFEGDIFYQIFPDRFNSSGRVYDNVPKDRVLVSDKGKMPSFMPNEKGIVENRDFYCGDFYGIELKLDYLKSLGVNTVYLNPIFEAQSNHRYDTSDYMRPDPLLGTKEDFCSLISAIHKRKMKLILDGVFSHTGADSVYFNKYGRYNSIGAYQSRKSPYYNWYNFKVWPDEYGSWWGIKILPEVDETNPGYSEFICGENGVLKYWLSLGVDGFRLDVADELPDEFLNKVYKSVKTYKKDAIVIGEVWEDATSKISYGHRRSFLLGNQMDSVMNYPFKSAVINLVKNDDREGFKNSIMSVLENYPAYAVGNLMNFLSTHDTERIITALAGKNGEGLSKEEKSTMHLTDDELKAGSDMVKTAYTVLYFLPGNPQIYYGDEVGMEGYSDPFNRQYYSDKNNTYGLLEYIREIGKIRNRYRGLLSSANTVISTDYDGFTVIRRTSENGEIVVVANTSKYEKKADFLAQFRGREKLLTWSKTVENHVFKPMSAAVFNISTL